MSEILLQENASFTNDVKSIALLYVHPENQELLWKIINKSPILGQMEQSSLHEKQKWFKSIIQLFYDKTGQETVAMGNVTKNSEHSTYSQLKQLNQDTIIYMVENLRKQLGQNKSTGISSPSYQEHNNSFSRADVYNSLPTHDQYSLRPPPKTNINDVADRQKEYESMLAKPLPPEMNFSEKIADEAISNMDELIAQHKKQREDELKQYAPINTENTVQTSVANVSEK